MSRWIEYRLLSSALAWRVGRTQLAGRWLEPDRHRLRGRAPRWRSSPSCCSRRCPPSSRRSWSWGPPGWPTGGDPTGWACPRPLATADRGLAGLATAASHRGGPRRADRARRRSKVLGMFKVFRRWWAYLTAKLRHVLRGAGRPEGPARTGHRRGAGPAAAPQGAGRQRHRPPEADRDAAQPRHGRAREGQRQRPPGGAHGRRGLQERRPGEGDAVHGHGRELRQPADRARARGRGPQGAAPAVDRGRQPGQGGGAAELVRPAAEAGRAPEAALPARPGEDAGADEHGHDIAVGGGGPGRADPQRGARQDRGPLRQGQGHGRAHRDRRSRAACSRSSRRR